MTVATDRPVLAVDVGGTKIALAIVDGGRILARRQVKTPRSGRGADIVLAIASEAAELPGPVVIGVATTGLVDRGVVTALNPQTLPIENNFPLRDALASRFNVPVLLVNDAQAAAWGEFKVRSVAGVKRMLYITVSTGIGGGIVLDGTLQMGVHGLAGHLGHVVADPAVDELCGCGRRGCLETVASGTGIAAAAEKTFGRSMSAPEVFAMAGTGNAAAETIVDRAARYLAITIANTVALLDLDRIVVGGGVGLAPGFLERVIEAAGQEPDCFQRPIERASLGADAGLVGVALLVSDGNFHRASQN